MTVMYIKINQQQALDLNKIMYNEVVTLDGIHFKFPYQRGTTQYIDPTLYNYAYVVMNEMTEVATYRTTVSNCLINQKTYEEASAAGWFPIPTPPI
jgi:hypothetical protein